MTLVLQLQFAISAGQGRVGECTWLIAAQLLGVGDLGCGGGSGSVWRWLGAVVAALLEGREKVIRFCHRMDDAATGDLAAATVLTGVHLDTEQRHSCPFPEDQLARARAMVSEVDPGI